MSRSSAKTADRIGGRRAAEAHGGTEDQAEKSPDGNRSADIAEHRDTRERKNTEADDGAEIGEDERGDNAFFRLPRAALALEKEGVVGADRDNQEESEQVEDREPSVQEENER